MLWTLNGFCHLQKLRGLRWTDGVSSCFGDHAMDPVLVQPRITRPLRPTSSGLQVCPDQTLTLLSTQLTLLLQPFSSPSPLTFRKQLQVLKEWASLLSSPISLSSSSPHLLSVQLCWLCGGPFSPLSVCTYLSLCPRAREQCPRTHKVEDGPCHSLLLLQGAPVPSVFPQPSVGALDHLSPSNHP